MLRPLHFNTVQNPRGNPTKEIVNVTLPQVQPTAVSGSVSLVDKLVDQLIIKCFEKHIE